MPEESFSSPSKYGTKQLGRRNLFSPSFLLIYNFLPVFQYIEVFLNIIFSFSLLGQNRSEKKIQAEFPSQSVQAQRTHQKPH